MKKTLLLFLMFLVAGCAAETPALSEVDVAVSDPTPLAATQLPPTDLPAPVVETAVPTEVVVGQETAVMPTDTPEPTAESEMVVVVESGRTPDGAFFLGSADAPLTLIDYSDFL